MKYLVGFAIFCAIIWYGSTHLGWMDWWTKADHGFWYEVQQTFNVENAKAKGRERQRKFDSY